MKRELEIISSAPNITEDEKTPKNKFRRILSDLLKNSMNKQKNVKKKMYEFIFYKSQKGF